MNHSIVRKVTASDVKDIQLVLSTTWQSTYTHLSQETIQKVKEKWHTTAFLTKQIENPSFHFLVAVENSKVVGIVTAAENEPTIIDVFRLYVLPNYQSKGVGSALLDAVEQHYLRAQKMRVYADQTNSKAILFYEKKGFQKIKKTEETTFGEVMVNWLMEKRR